MPLSATILIFGHDPMLLDTRRWVLERAGFNVITVPSSDRVAQIVTDESVDVLLLCHTLTPAERQAAVASAKAIRPYIKKLVMTTNAQEVSQEEVDGANVDLFAGAPGLIAATRRALDENEAG